MVFRKESEAVQALQALDTLEPFVKGRLGAKRQTYTRTGLLVLGEPGFRRLGMWNRWMERFAETNARQEPDWLAPFQQWLHTV